MKVFVIDDEPLARSRLQRLLRQIPNVSYLGEAADAAEAWQCITTLQPDVLLLDIDMPGEDGLAFAARLNELALPPAIVFVTAHPEHALEAYQVSAADYLVKPVDVARLQQSLNKVGVLTRAHQRSFLQQPPITPKISYQCGLTVKSIALSDIYYFHADSKYVTLHFAEGEAVVDVTLTELEQRFPQLLRIHRSYLLNPLYFAALKQQKGSFIIQLSNTSACLPVSRRCVAHVKQVLQLENKST